MNSLGGRHPDDECLLRYADGELQADQATEVHSHLKACWRCRVQLESLGRVVNECVHYYQTAVAPYAPPPPRDWVDMKRRLADVERSLSQPSFQARVRIAFSAVRRFRMPALSVGLTAVVAIVVFSQLYRTPSARAAELLQRAVSLEKGKPVAPRRIEIRSRGRRYSRMLGGISTTKEDRAHEGGLSADDRKELDHLQALFASANYSWAAPLSARTFSFWREALRDKRDEVTVQKQPQMPNGDFYRLRTTTESGNLVEATILLRASDLQPIEGSWRFRSDELVEMSEVSSDHASEGTAERTSDQAHQAPDERTPTVPVASQGTVGPAEELRVLVALHKLDADLGELFEVTRTANEVLVTGIGVEPERQRQVQMVLGTLPQVATRFLEGPTPGAAANQELTASISATPSTEQARSWLERQLGNRDSVEFFTQRVLGLADAIAARSHALRSLAGRFPSEIERQLTPADDKILTDLRTDHGAALNLKTLELRALLRDALKDVDSSGSGLSTAATAQPLTWQTAAEQVMERAWRVEKFAAGLTAGAPTGIPLSSIPAQLRSTLTEIEDLSTSFTAAEGNRLGGPHR